MASIVHFSCLGVKRNNSAGVKWTVFHSFSHLVHQMKFDVFVEYVHVLPYRINVVLSSWLYIINILIY